MNMNRIATTVSFGLALGMLTVASAATAETVKTTKTTTYSGMVSEVNPSTSTIILRSDTSPAPVTYTYSKETTFVDAKGNVVTYETIKNSPVTVEYTTDGGTTVVRKVTQTAPAVQMVPVVPVPGAPTIKTTTRTETETR